MNSKGGIASISSEVALYLKGDELDPDHVTKVLGITPSKTQRKGEARITSTNRQYVTKTGLWSLSRKQKTLEIGPVLRELASELMRSGSPINAIDGVAEAYVDVFIALDADPDGEGTCAFTFSPIELEAALLLGVPCRFTVAVVKP